MLDNRRLPPQDEVDLALAEMAGWSEEMAGWSEKAFRVARGVAYFLVSALLLSANTYGAEAFWTVSIAIGVFGLMGTSARIGQACIAVLAIMAVVPASALAAIVAALS